MRTGTKIKATVMRDLLSEAQRKLITKRLMAQGALAVEFHKTNYMETLLRVRSQEEGTYNFIIKITEMT